MYVGLGKNKRAVWHNSIVPEIEKLLGRKMTDDEKLYADKWAQADCDMPTPVQMAYELIHK